MEHRPDDLTEQEGVGDPSSPDEAQQRRREPSQAMSAQDSTDGVSDHDLTGHPAVDEVVRSLGGLEDAPVADHVPVFEAAHEKLRSALADAGDDGDQPS